jgi:hypothetical protein
MPHRSKGLDLVVKDYKFCYIVPLKPVFYEELKQRVVINVSSYVPYSKFTKLLFF